MLCWNMAHVLCRISTRLATSNSHVADNNGAGLCMQMGFLRCVVPATLPNFIIGERDYANAVTPYWNVRGGLVIKRVPADILGLSFSHAHHC